MKLSHELQTAITAAKAAGNIHLKYFQKPLHKTMKGTKDFATQADLQAEQAIVKILQKEFPDYSILSEEAGNLGAESQSRWIVDPLDETIWYSAGFPVFGVLIALEKKGKLELGVVFQPHPNYMLFAQKKKGTFLNNQRVHCSKRNRLANAFIGYHGIRFALNQYRHGFETLLSKAYWRTGIPNLPALQFVCSGVLDVFLNCPNPHGKTIIKPWDIAAHKIILEEAGGVFSNYHGETELNQINATVLTNGALHSKVIRILKEGKP